MRRRSAIVLFAMVLLPALVVVADEVRVTGPSETFEQGRTVTLTWRVTGTTEPVRLRVVNRNPDTGVLHGGNEQTLTSTGGTPNTLSLKVTGTRPGNVDIDVQVANDRNDRNDGNDETELDRAYRFHLNRIADEIEAFAAKVPAEDGDDSTVRAEWVVSVLANAREDLRKSLPQREFAALHDAVAELVELAEVEFLNLPAAGMTSAAGSQTIQRSTARAFLSYVAGLFRRNGTAPSTQKICVRTRTRGADVKVFPPSFPSDDESVQSISTLSLAIGKYVYRVSGDGFLPSQGTFNLFKNPERVIEFPQRRNDRESQSVRYHPGPAEPCR